jgi:hypothetical protein
VEEKIIRRFSSLEHDRAQNRIPLLLIGLWPRLNACLYLRCCAVKRTSEPESHQS